MDYVSNEDLGDVGEDDFDAGYAEEFAEWDAFDDEFGDVTEEDLDDWEE